MSFEPAMGRQALCTHLPTPVWLLERVLSWHNPAASVALDVTASMPQIVHRRRQ